MIVALDVSSGHVRVTVAVAFLAFLVNHVWSTKETSIAFLASRAGVSILTIAYNFEIVFLFGIENFRKRGERIDKLGVAVPFLILDVVVVRD